MTTPLAEALEGAWERFGGRDGLVADLGLDAVLATARVASRGEQGMRSVTPRLLELATSPDPQPADLDGSPRWVPIDELVAAGWPDWPPADRAAIQRVLDAWWAETLNLEATAPGVEEVLGTLVHSGVELVRWLEPWLADLDGPPAVHLAELVLGGLRHQVWEGHEDARGRVAAWLRTEPVVVGVTVVGGIHLDDGVLSEVLEVILA